MHLTKESEQLLAALRANTCSPAHELLVPSKGSSAKLQELVEAWPTAAKEDLSQAVLHQVKVALASFHADAEAHADENAEIESQQVVQTEELLICLVCLIRTMAEEGQGAVASALQAAARHLHDQGILMADGAAELQDAVVKLCCLWWQKELPGKADMVPQMIPYLLYQATFSGRATDVKRCYSARGALALLDFDDPSIQGVQALMVRAAMLPPFLRCADGRKFIAHLFTLHPKMVYELTAVILNQIVSGRKSVLDAYGEIIFKAWRAATGACLERIETHLIQNSLIRSALRASSPALAASLRRVLEGLHSQRLTPGTDAMLLRLYHPLLFRDLAAANAGVRNNALQLLIDAFPLQDTSSSAEESDELLQQQFEELSKGLRDEAPAVRITAASGICALLNTYWELIPSAITAAYLKHLTDEVAYDSTSPGVRLAAVQGLTGLVDNPLAQPLLRVVLPKLGPLLHDTALKLRVAVADLLLTVMRVRELHFVDIVDVEQLLNVMGQDVPQVAERVQRLLLPSYFPDGGEGPARVAMLLRQNPTAGKAFCASLFQAPVERVVELVAALRDHLLSSAPAQDSALAATEAGPSKGSKRRRGRKQMQAVAGSPGQPEEENAEVVQQETAEAWHSLLEGLAELCTGLATAVAAGQEEDTALQGLFPTNALVQLLGLCQSAPCRGLVMHIAAALTEAPAAVAVQARCLKRLVNKTSREDSMRDTELKATLQCVVAGPSRAALMTTLTAALGPSLSSKSPDEATAGMSPTTALRCLDVGLKDDGIRALFTSEGLLANALPLLQPSAAGCPADALMTAMAALPGTCEDGRAKQAALAPAALVMYNRVALHLQIASTELLPQKHQQDSRALPALVGAVDNIQTRQSSAERDLLAQEQEHRDRESYGIGSAAAAEAAVLASCEVALQVLQQLQCLEASTVNTVAVIEPRRKKGRSNPDQACTSTTGLSCQACIQAGHSVVTGVLAVAGDAARLLQWACCTPAAVATFEIATALLAWAHELCQMSSESEVIQLRDSALLRAMTLVAATRGPTVQSQGHPQVQPLGSDAPVTWPADSDTSAVRQQYQPVGSAAAVQASNVTHFSSFDELEALAEAVMQQGCLEEEGMTAHLMKPFLPGVLRALSEVPTASRWLLPLACLIGNIMTANKASLRGAPGVEQGSVVGPQEPQGSPSLRGLDSSQMPTQLNDQLPPDDADTKQARNKENVSVNQAAPNRSQGRSKQHAETSSAGEAESFAIDHAFVKAVLAAAHAAQVKEQLAGISATLALQSWQQGNFASSLGAVHLICMLGFPSPSASMRGLGRTESFRQCSEKIASCDPSIDQAAPFDFTLARLTAVLQLRVADQKKQRRLANNRATASVSRSRKRDHLQTLQVRLGYLEKENARMTQKLIQQDAELDKFRQGLPSNHPADIGKAEEEAVAVQELSQCPKAVVLRPAQSALPRIFCSVANPPSSSYPQRPQTAPQDTLLNGIIQGPTRRSKRMADSYAAIDTRQDSGSHGLTDVAEPVSGSSSDQQASKSVHADEASRQTSVERSVSPTTEALPGVTLPANQPASFGIITSGDSSQLTLKCERSVNLIHLSGQRAPPHTSEYPVKRQATPSAMHPGSMTQGHDSLHLEPAALSHEHIHHHNHFHHQQQQQPDMVQTGSCHFDSLQMHAPTGLADATAQSYSGQAPDAQQPVQQAAWASAHLQTDQFSMLGILPVGMLHEGSSESGSGSSSPKQRAGWGWSVTTGHDKHAAQYGSDQDAQFSRLPMSGQAQLIACHVEAKIYKFL
ncbi:hypothetical protein WJX77_005190 [Trebouxia sp. C0004]